MDIKNIRVKIKVHNFEDEIMSDDYTMYEKYQWHLFASYGNVQTRQNWKFTFNGTNLNENKKFQIIVIYKI